ncbi:hypothetical protein SAMN05192558_110182 [Actinokineospora alba]|uniref:DUF5709 domain-containing protein n=1 Tax=Actinokineospora alba TaxID=504798 RepID=A0A1H0TUI5_9PSEU|nr:hypothetical protein [Actinokineospora alba]TDP70703.1 hypothetical protein C8E96_6331 [Actinokineospora alba]SDJ14132.1 hypothetical protein SAMN05421871_110182 [Actinokineospora alba]SDP57206.1 hypothetical protein SAMN05192558_110182 [Actinokineospora alba]
MTEPRSEQQEGLDQDGVAEGVRDDGFVSLTDPDGEDLPGDLIDTEGTEIARDTGSARPSGPEDRAMHLEEG